MHPAREYRSVEPIAAGLARIPLLPRSYGEHKVRDEDSDSGDSHYELPVTWDTGDDDSQESVLPDVPKGMSSNDEVVLPAGRRPVLETAIASQRFLHLINECKYYHFALALAFGALSLAFLGFSLVEAWIGNQSLSLSINVLVTAGMALVAFSLLQVMATALNVFLLDRDRNVRRPRMQKGQDTRVESE